MSLPFKTTGSLYFARDWVELQLHSQPGPQLSLQLHPPPPQPTVGSSIPNGLPDDSASALGTQILATSRLLLFRLLRMRQLCIFSTARPVLYLLTCQPSAYEEFQDQDCDCWGLENCPVGTKNSRTLGMCLSSALGCGICQNNLLS